MKHVHVGAIVSALFVLGGFLVQADTSKPDVPTPDTAELAKAVAAATAKLQGIAKSPADYKLIKVELTWTKGNYAWRTTYKLLKLLPKDPSKEAIGAGGEVFITVDLETGQTDVRHGE